jgi:hypothetical protein
MTERVWISAQEAVERLQGTSDDPRDYLLRLAQNGIVKTRASSVSWDADGTECGRFRERNGNELTPDFWAAVTAKGWKDWRQGSFGFDETAPTALFGSGEVLNWSVKGIEFNWNNIAAHLAHMPASIELMRGKLPQGASRNHRKHEGRAHAVADIIRSEDIDRAKAIRKVLDQELLDQSTERSSIEMAVRRTYDLMYHPDGTARQN